ncbi:MAG: 16S rRNA (cytosine(1402)-N(4))-methyltransferase RsmH [Candidatus Pelagibacterales bacterium]|tara:strand:+ start:2211 stop:3197 length:987 start_codon:yes stop_codon:yes gene_type:complete
MNGDTLEHTPVLLNEVIRTINPQSGKLYFDATFGWGGYTKKLLDSCACQVIAIDQDPKVKSRAKEFKREYGTRFNFIESKFSEICSVLKKLNTKKVDGFMFDIGVSSMQLDNPQRGFSFNKEGPLDMRMGNSELTAEEFINSVSEDELADIIYNYGDERKSRKIAKLIVEHRKINPIKTTLHLADIVLKANPKKNNHKKHPATKTFQAIRIYLNDEFNELFAGLTNAEQTLSEDGKICVVTFHSLEDKIVKNYFYKSSGKDYSSYKNLPVETNDSEASLIPGKKAIKPSKEEIETNIRARSAKLRYATRTSSLPNNFTLDDIGFREFC